MRRAFRSRRRGREAFTLVEVLVALSILAVLLMICTIGFTGLLTNSKRRIDEAARRRAQEEVHDGDFADSAAQAWNRLSGKNHRPSGRAPVPVIFGNNRETRTLYESLQLPFTPDHFIQIAGFYRALGLYDGAVRNALVAIEMAPERAELHTWVGNVFLLKKDWEKARFCFEQAVSNDSGSAGGHMGLGRALVALGDVGDGLTHMLEAVDLAPENADYLARIGQVYFEFDDTAKARDYLSRALDMRRDIAQLVKPDILEALGLASPTDT